MFDVRDAQEDVLHLVDAELPRGPVEGCIDWSRRFDHMQQHTGQHLLSAVFQERSGLPTVSFHLGGDACTIDLRGPEPTADALRGAQRAANQIIFDDRPVNVRYGTAEQLAAQGVRKEVEREGILRAIEIESADLQPCGGTHVKSTGQIGLILIRRCTKIRQDWRVEFACGGRAERTASDDAQLLRSLAEKLSCAATELPAVIEKSAAERDSNFKNLQLALGLLAESWTHRLLSATPIAADGSRVVVALLSSAHPGGLLLPLATELARTEQTIALLVHESTGQLVLAQSPGAGKDLPSVLKRVLGAIPGKGGGARDFVRAKLTDPRQSAAALDLAKQLVGQ